MISDYTRETWGDWLSYNRQSKYFKKYGNAQNNATVVTVPLIVFKQYFIQDMNQRNYN